jgi:hypothetical protein
MRPWLANILLIALVASGCSSLPSLVARPPSAPPERATAPYESPSPRERLRDSVSQEAITPARFTEPSAAPLPPRSEEPDPRALIDWLLKDRK